MTKTDAIKAEYAPYDRFPAFWDGYDDYKNGRKLWMWRPDANSADAQAYDRGAEAAMRVIQAERTS